MSIEAVKKLAESWIAEAKLLDDSADITLEYVGVPLTPEKVASRKRVAYDLDLMAKQVLAAAAESGDDTPKIELPDLASAGENLTKVLAWRIEQRWPEMREAARISYQRSAEKFLAPYIARIAELESRSMPEPSASPNHEFVFGSVQSMRIRVWNETSRAVSIVDFDGVADPAGYIAAFVAGFSPLGSHPEARRAEEPKHEPDLAGSVKRYLDDGGKWDLIMSTTDDQARAAIDKLEAAVHCYHDQDNVRLDCEDMQAIIALRNWARDQLTLSASDALAEKEPNATRDP